MIPVHMLNVVARKETGKQAIPGNGFVALLAILVLISFTASLIAIAVTG
jgi:hypothetical protein